MVNELMPTQETSIISQVTSSGRVSLSNNLLFFKKFFMTCVYSLIVSYAGILCLMYSDGIIHCIELRQVEGV